MKIALGH